MKVSETPTFKDIGEFGVSQHQVTRTDMVQWIMKQRSKLDSLTRE